jgi:hypothetical protein
MKAKDWIEKVLTHRTEDHVHNPAMVASLVRLATVIGREHVIPVLEAYEKYVKEEADREDYDSPLQFQE